MGVFTIWVCDHCDREVRLNGRQCGLPMLWERLRVTIDSADTPLAVQHGGEKTLCDDCASNLRQQIDKLLHPKKRSANLAEIYGKATLADIIARGPEKP